MTANAADTLLLVEDDAVFRAALGRALTHRGFHVVEAGTVAEALTQARRSAPGNAVLDLRLPDGSGLDLLGELLRIAPALRAVILTGWGSIATAMQAVRLGAVDFLAKPVDPDRVASALRSDRSKVAEGDVAVAEQVPSLDRVEWEHIQRVLAECEGNVSKTARLLGLHRRSLQRKLGKRPSAR